MKTVLCICEEALFADALTRALLGGRLPAFNLLLIDRVDRLTERLEREEPVAVIYDRAAATPAMNRRVMQIRRFNRTAKFIEILPNGEVPSTPDSLLRTDSLAKLENLLEPLLDEPERQPHAWLKPRLSVDKAAAMTVANLGRLEELHGLYQKRDRKRFLALVESVLSVNENHTRVCYQAGDLLLHSMTAFVESFVCVWALQPQLEAAIFPEPGFNEKVNNRRLLAFWERFANLIFDENTDQELPPLILRTLQFVEEHLEEELPVSAIAETVGVTTGYLSRAFSHHMGKTLIGYISEQKIERAKTLLTQTDATVKDIAAAIGFSSPGYFIRFFKKFTGVTPLKFRETQEVDHVY